MSILNTNATVTYSGNGSQVNFPITFDLQDNSQVFVTKKDLTSLIVSTLVIGVDYTISGGNPGNLIIATTAPTTNEELTVYRSTARTQIYDFLNNSAFLAEDLEKAIDRIVMMVQEIVAGTSSGGGNYTITIFGSVAAPRTIAAATGFTFALSDMSITASEQVIFTSSALTAGEVTVTANPQIQAGTVLGQKMTLVGVSNADYIVLSTGSGLVLNGDWKSTSGSVLDLRWNGTAWFETTRNLGV